MQSLLILIFIAGFSGPMLAAQSQSSKSSSQSQAKIPSLAAKPSLKNLGERLQKTSQVTQLFKDTKDWPNGGPAAKEFQKSSLAKAVLELEKQNSSVLKEWLKYNQDSTPFIRGEIDDEPVINNLLVAIQLSVLQARLDALAGQWSQFKADLDPWFIYASDMTYEEASLISLRVANVIRSLILDEIEKIENAKANEFSASDLEAWLQWTGSVRASWPIDRILITEAKKILTNKPMFTAQQMAIALQKNAYQTAAQALKEAQGPKTPEMKLLEKMWREEDIQAMKTEVHRLSALKIRLAKDLFAKKFSKEPAQIQELVDQHLLKDVPLDYATGKPFSLPKAALH